MILNGVEKQERKKKLNGNPELKISAQLNTAGRFFFL